MIDRQFDDSAACAECWPSAETNLSSRFQRNNQHSRTYIEQDTLHILQTPLLSISIGFGGTDKDSRDLG